MYFSENMYMYRTEAVEMISCSNQHDQGKGDTKSEASIFRSSLYISVADHPQVSQSNILKLNPYLSIRNENLNKQNLQVYRFYSLIVF